MIDRRIGKIKVRRGTDAQRKPVVFEEGELVYSIDKKRLYIGDEVTAGGILISNRNYVVNTLGIPPVVPSEAVYGDIVYDKNTGSTYIIGYNLDQSLRLILIASSGGVDCCATLQAEIDDLYTRLRSLTGCIDPKPDTFFILSEDGDTILAENGDFIIWN